MADHLNLAPEEEVAGGDGLGHDGELEVEVIEVGDISEAEDAEVRPRSSGPQELLPRRRQTSIWQPTFPTRRGVTYA